MSGAIWTGNMEVERAIPALMLQFWIWKAWKVNRYQFHATFADTITRHMAENTILSSNQFQASLKKHVPEFLQGQPGLEKSL